MVIEIVDEHSEGHSRCEQCNCYIPNRNMCYCMDCDIAACIYCVYKAHLGTQTRSAHELFWKNLLPLDPDDLIKCANLRCRDFKFRHSDGSGNCSVCETSVGNYTTKEEGDLLRCHKFIDERPLTEDDKFWQSFRYACAVTSGEDVQYARMEALRFAVMVRHWGWSEGKFERVLKKAMAEGTIVEVPETLYHRAAKHSNVLVGNRQQ